MRMIRADPQPVFQYQQDYETCRYLLPNPKVDWGGMFFSYPVRGIYTGELIPTRVGDRELLKIDGVWYWLLTK